MRRNKRSIVDARIDMPAANSAEKDAPLGAKQIKYDAADDVPPLPTFTVRERDVLYWVARGKGNGEVAEILDASPETVRKHVQNIRQKFGSESRPAVIARYWERQLYESALSIKEHDQEIQRLKRQESSEE